MREIYHKNHNNPLNEYLKKKMMMKYYKPSQILIKFQIKKIIKIN